MPPAASAAAARDRMLSLPAASPPGATERRPVQRRLARRRLCAPRLIQKAGPPAPVGRRSPARATACPSPLPCARGPSTAGRVDGRGVTGVPGRLSEPLEHASSTRRAGVHASSRSRRPDPRWRGSRRNVRRTRAGWGETGPRAVTPGEDGWMQPKEAAGADEASQLPYTARGALTPPDRIVRSPRSALPPLSASARDRAAT